MAGRDPWGVSDRMINHWLHESWCSQDPGRIRYPVINNYMLIDDKLYEVKEITVHEFTMGDVEDPDLYAAEPLYNWQKSEQGQWVMKNALETPSWYRMTDHVAFGYKYAIRAKFIGPKITEWYLKFK